MEQIEALDEELAALQARLTALTPDGWAAPTRCPGWDVADVVLHLAQTNELAAASAGGRWDEHLASLRPTRAAVSVDDAAAVQVEAERGAPTDALLARWIASADSMRAALASGSPSDRVPWVAGELARRTLATTRQSETWIHHGDVADAVGEVVPPTDRLRFVARLAWRTLPYAFGLAGRTLSGPVAMHLVGLDGAAWELVPDEPARTVVRGPGVDLCEVAARRRAPADTALETSGPDGAAVLELIRTYA